jgi:PII-like signaling protein
MHLSVPGKRLTIYCGERDHYRQKPLALAIVERARHEGLTGATVTHGIAGFGASSRLHTSHSLALSDDLPMVVEIIDIGERVIAFLAVVDEMMGDGLITMEDVTVTRYWPGRHARGHEELA